jgi:DNA invertase Pin-like site-specific DNA recombinase
MKYGYARVSTHHQNPALQTDALKKAQCDHIFQDKLTGVTTNQPQLTRCLKKLRARDTLIVWKLDRLGRSLRDLINTLDGLRDRGIRIHSLTENIDTETPTGRAMWQMIALLAELERSLIIERTRAGMQAARACGIRPGPKPKLSPAQIEHVRKLRKQRESADAIAGILGCSRATVYRALT